MIDLNGAKVFVSGGTGSFGNALIDYLHNNLGFYGDVEFVV